MGLFRVFVKQERVYDMVVTADNQEEAEGIAVSDLGDDALVDSYTDVYDVYEIQEILKEVDHAGID